MTTGQNHIRDAQYLINHSYSATDGFAKQVLISEKPRALEAASQTQKDWERWNQKGDDLIQQLNHPTLISEERYQREQRNGIADDQMPYERLNKTPDYLRKIYSGDYQLLLKQGSDLPPQKSFYQLQSVENKQLIKPSMYKDFWDQGFNRSFHRRDHSKKLEGIVPIDYERPRPPLISPDVHSVTVPKNVKGVIHDEKYNLGRFFQNQTEVESLVTPDVFLNADRSVILRRRDIAANHVQLMSDLRSNVALNEQIETPFPGRQYHPSTAAHYDGVRIQYPKDKK